MNYDNSIENIKSKIYTIRGLQIMLDEDIAQLYGVETRRLNEQGVAMLSAILRSETAIKVSVQIMNAFVRMRRFIRDNAQVFQRLDSLEIRQIESVLTAIEDRMDRPIQGIFYNGQVFDAWQFVSDIVRSANRSIILIDNYIDDRVLTLFSKREEKVTVTIMTKNISRQLNEDIKKFNNQYPPIEVKQFAESHDRFMIIDETYLYHFGASLKDLGKKWFAFSKMEIGVVELLDKLKKSGGFKNV